MEKNNEEDYYKKKISDVMKEIKPICDAFNIKYGYEVRFTTHGIKEILFLNGQQIGCTSDSIDAIVSEVVGYIFLTRYCTRRIFPFKNQIIHHLKKYWIGEIDK